MIVCFENRRLATRHFFLQTSITESVDKRGAGRREKNLGSYVANKVFCSHCEWYQKTSCDLLWEDWGQGTHRLRKTKDSILAKIPNKISLFLQHTQHESNKPEFNANILFSNPIKGATLFWADRFLRLSGTRLNYLPAIHFQEKWGHKIGGKRPHSFWFS